MPAIAPVLMGLLLSLELPGPVVGDADGAAVGTLVGEYVGFDVYVMVSTTGVEAVTDSTDDELNKLLDDCRTEVNAVLVAWEVNADTTLLALVDDDDCDVESTATTA